MLRGIKLNENLKMKNDKDLGGFENESAQDKTGKLIVP